MRHIVACMALVGLFSLIGCGLLLISAAAGDSVFFPQRRYLPYTCPVENPVAVETNDPRYDDKPDVDGAITFIGGSVKPWHGPVTTVTSPIYDKTTDRPAIIGRLANMDKATAIKAVYAAAAAWDDGQGEWPQMPLAVRIQAIKNYVQELKESREAIVNTLEWEICKTTADAAKEFDRTMDFINAVIEAALSMDKEPPTVQRPAMGNWIGLGDIRARVRRGPIGVMLAMAPFNYPLNEMYAMLIPALMMGNTAVLKLPAVGGLAHVQTIKALAKSLPKGVINFVSGSGRLLCAPIMETGLVDVLGFIGGTKAVDALIRAHPAPHRLKVFSQLAAKNIAAVMSDADLNVAVEQVTLGSLSYNGQRCTATKLIMVQESIIDEFLPRFVASVEKLPQGLPWQPGVAITPLPEPGKADYLEGLIADAVRFGAQVVNAEQGGGTRKGGLFHPAVLYPVTPDMVSNHTNPKLMSKACIPFHFDGKAWALTLTTNAHNLCREFFTKSNLGLSCR